MMKTKIINANILTKGELFFGEILIDNGIIVNIAKTVDSAEKIIDAKNNLILPGLINCHAHSPMSLLKNVASKNQLQNWLEEDIFPKEKKLKQGDYYWGAMFSIAEMLKNGITSFCDAYMGEEEIFNAIKTSKMRANLCLGFHNISDNLEKVEKQYLKLKNQATNNIKFSFYAHSVYDCLPSQFDKLVELRAKYSVPLYTHISETLNEVGNCANEHKKTPVELLESFGFFDGKSTVAHAVHLDKIDFDILSNYNVNVVSCPASNLKLASGICPIVALDNHKINIALGTDSSASNNQLDLFKEMFLLNALQRVQMHDANAITVEKTFDMATVNGSKILDFENLGTIEIGKLADLIMLNLNSLNFLNNKNILEQIIFNCSSSDILLTMVNGETLYDNGNFYIGEDIKTIKSNCEKINARLFV